MSKKAKKGKFPQRKIVVRHEAVDGAKGHQTLTSLKFARLEAHKWVGEHPEIGSHYAVSGDGVVRVTVEGATLAEIFPTFAKGDLEQPVTDITEQQQGGTNDERETLDERDDGGSAATEAANLEAGTTGAGTSSGDPSDGADEEVRKSSSVVAAKFKDRYLANARERGIKGKAARRSNWDWLAQIIARECLTKDKLNIERFKALMDANGVDHSKWNNESRGWEGRFRMTGRVALQRIVADRGVLYLPEGTAEQAPADFVEKYKTKA